MKTDIHPKYDEVTVTCVCGNKIKTRSTMGKDFHVEICSNCHPFFTGKQKLVDTAGRVDRFRKKYGDNYAQVAAEKVAAEKAEKAAKQQAAAKPEPVAEPAVAEAPAAEDTTAS